MRLVFRMTMKKTVIDIHDLREMSPWFRGILGSFLGKSLIKLLRVDKVNKVHARNCHLRGAEFTSALLRDPYIDLRYEIHNKELLERFSQAFVDTAKGFDQYLSVLPDSRIAVEHGVSAMHDVTEGGIYGALWEVAEASGIGLEIDLKAIPIRQETIEICEYFSLNPYQLFCSDTLLAALPDGARAVRELAGQNIPAAVIGRTTAGKERWMPCSPPQADICGR